MRYVKYFVLVVILLFASTSCKPDLSVSKSKLIWDQENKKAKAVITNIGNGSAGEFLVYFNGDENPESLNRRPQIVHTVPGLARRDSVSLEADFAPLAHSDNNNLENVYKITVIVDPKNMVNESNENNNIKEEIIN